MGYYVTFTLYNRQRSFFTGRGDLLNGMSQTRSLRVFVSLAALLGDVGCTQGLNPYGFSNRIRRIAHTIMASRVPGAFGLDATRAATRVLPFHPSTSTLQHATT